MKYNQQMEQWIINNYPLRSIKENVELFNNKFNCNMTYDALRKKAYDLKLPPRKRKGFTKEQKEYFIKIYKLYTPLECCKLLEEKFGIKYTKNSVISYATKNKITGIYYSKDELDFLKNNCKFFTYKMLTEMFNILFDRNKTRDQIRDTCKHNHWYCISEVNYYTKEQDQWLKDNYPNESYTVAEITDMFNKKFNDNRSANCIKIYCIQHHYIRVQEHYHFNLGNIPWSKGLTKEEHKRHFTAKNYEKLINIHKEQFPNIIRRKQYEEQYNIKLPKDVRLTDITGNGDYIPIKKIYVDRLHQDKKKLGELTKLFYTIYETEDLIKNKKRK